MKHEFSGRLFLLLTSVIVPALVSCSGCSSDPGVSPNAGKPNYHRFDQPLQPKKAAELSLSRSVSRNNYTAGKLPKNEAPQKISVRLANHNLESVTIREWRQNENENVRISIAEPADVPKWRQVWPASGPQKEKADVSHYTPVTLAPGTGILLDVPAAFLETFDMRGAAVKSLRVRVELDAASAFAQPLEFEIRVRGKQPKKVREIIIAD